MYFPNGFDRNLSIELGQLVQQAYVQYEAFEKGEPWKLKGGYSLAFEVSYVWTAGKALDAGKLGFDKVLKAAGRQRTRKAVNIPIGFMAQRSGRNYLIFRGTITATEWIRNFGINLSPYLLPSYGKVHDGFLQSYSLVRQDMMEAINSISNHANVLLVAGHSLGAAIATLAVPDIEANSSAKVRFVYLYGSPRVGDSDFAQAYNITFARKSFRIANSSDLVTSLPLPVPIAGLVGGFFCYIDTPVDMTIQNNDLEKNHEMKTYLSVLSNVRRRSILGRILRKNV